MCGEHPFDGSSCPGCWGSSPHVRGAHAIGDRLHRGGGIIPACAGSTCRERSKSLKHGDHPRMCGEHRFTQFNALSAAGSSPHVRGARRLHRLLRRRPGIIPACAGSTMATVILLTNWRDHPRMCGEHADNSSMTFNSEGSSPHVRGALAVELNFYISVGIIPACAGSTLNLDTANISIRDHPRMCGEHVEVI